MKYDVFISYSRKDYVDANKQVIPGNIVSQIKALFDKNGISYWFDEEGIYSGDAFARVIARNIKASKMLLFISTANSNQSQWTSDEIAVAREYGKKIIPFRYDQSHYNEDVIIYIARLDYIDYLANPKVALNRLLSSVKEFLQTESQKEIEKKRAEEQRIMEERLINERAKRVQVIDDSIVKHKDELRSIEQSIIECEKSLLELKYKRDKLNVALKELNDERVALLSFVHMTQNQTQAKSVKRALEAVGVDVEIFKRRVLPKYDVLISKVGINRLQVVQCVRMLTNLPLKDSKEIVDRVPSFIKEGVTEQEAMSAKRALEAVGVGVEIFVDKTSWDVYLKSSGPVKLQVIKVVKDTMGLTLSEALQTVNNAPCYVARKMSKSAATKFVKLLFEAGAEVELR